MSRPAWNRAHEAAALEVIGTLQFRRWLRSSKMLRWIPVRLLNPLLGPLFGGEKCVFLLKKCVKAQKISCDVQL